MGCTTMVLMPSRVEGDGMGCRKSVGCLDEKDGTGEAGHVRRCGFC